MHEIAHISKIILHSSLKKKKEDKLRKKEYFNLPT